MTRVDFLKSPFEQRDLYHLTELESNLMITKWRVPDLFITSLITDRIGRKIQSKQNHVIGLMFYATLSGKNTDSVLYLYLISWKS